MPDSRRYLKRIWRVPKPASPFPVHKVRPEERLGVLVLKMLRKHGWPAVLEVVPSGSPCGAFIINHDQAGRDAPADFLDAVGIAVRICAARHRVRVSEWRGMVEFDHFYYVRPDGTFKEIPDAPGSVYTLR